MDDNVMFYVQEDIKELKRDNEMMQERINTLEQQLLILSSQQSKKPIFPVGFTQKIMDDIEKRVLAKFNKWKENTNNGIDAYVENLLTKQRNDIIHRVIGVESHYGEWIINVNNDDSTVIQSMTDIIKEKGTKHIIAALEEFSAIPLTKTFIKTLKNEFMEVFTEHAAYIARDYGEAKAEKYVRELFELKEDLSE